MSTNYMFIAICDDGPEVSIHSDFNSAQAAMHDKIQLFIKAVFELYNGPYDTPWADILNQIAAKGRFDDGEYLYLDATSGGIRQEEVSDGVVLWYICPCPNEIKPGTVIKYEGTN